MKRKRSRVPMIEGNLGHYSQDEYQRRVDMSYGYAAGYAGSPRSATKSPAWLEGYDRAAGIVTSPDFLAMTARAKALRTTRVSPPKPKRQAKPRSLPTGQTK